MKYLLDTNICIYVIKKRPSEVFEKFQTVPLGDIGISVITLCELYFGVEKSSDPEKNKKALEQFLLPLEIYPLEFSMAIEYGKIRNRLEQKGTPIGSLDIFIAAHAKTLELTLVTNNLHEFERIDGLQIENWIAGNS